jgi:hypothetical protein
VGPSGEEKNPCPLCESNRSHPAHSPISILTELPRLPTVMPHSVQTAALLPCVLLAGCCSAAESVNRKKMETPCSADALPRNQSTLDVPARNLFAHLRTTNKETASISKPDDPLTSAG